MNDSTCCLIINILMQINSRISSSLAHCVLLHFIGIAHTFFPPFNASLHSFFNAIANILFVLSSLHNSSGFWETAHGTSQPFKYIQHSRLLPCRYIYTYTQHHNKAQLSRLIHVHYNKRIVFKNEEKNDDVMRCYCNEAKPLSLGCCYCLYML